MMTKFYMSVVIALNLMGSRGKMEGWGGRAKLLLGWRGDHLTFSHHGRVFYHKPLIEENISRELDI